MLNLEEIQQLMEEDRISDKKKFARKGQDYYEGDHDIKGYRLFYYNADGNLVEDKTRSNVKIPHAFFAELVDQAVQYMLSGSDGFIKSDFPELQSELDLYFNCNEDFTSELSETLTGCMSKGFEYMYAYKNQDDRISFQCADSLGVVEVRTKESDSETEYIIYSYLDRVERNRKKITRIQVWDRERVYFFLMTDKGKIIKDESEKLNPKPHAVYEHGKKIYYKGFGFIPFFRLDNNKKQFSCLSPIKDLIDDYDLMASSLSNNLIDFDTPIHVVKGLEGDSMDELIQNLKTKKVLGLEAEANSGVDIKTVDIPYQARLTKLELDEKNIYRFGMGLNTSGLKDTNATTNIAIKAAYSLFDLKCSKLEIRLMQFLRKLIKPVLSEINERNKTDYQMKDIYFDFKHEVMSNAQENAQIALTEAQAKQTEINTLLNLASNLDNETLMQNICGVLDIDYEEIKDKLVNPLEFEEDVNNATNNLDDAVDDR